MKEKILDTKSIVLCGMFTALIAAGAFIRIPIPMVPFTLQVLFTNLAALLLGKKRGLISVALYIFIGLVGIPIFVSGGGPGYIFQPTFGYLIGMAVGAYIAGSIVEKGNNDMKTYITASFVNLVIIYLLGMVYYYIVARFYIGNPIAVKKLVIYCCLVFIPGDGLSCVIGSLIAKRLRPVLNKNYISQNPVTM